MRFFIRDAGVPTMKAEDVKPTRLGGGFGSGLRLKKAGEQSSTDAAALRAARLRRYEAFHGTGQSLSGKKSTFGGVTSGGNTLGGSSNGGYSLNGASSSSSSSTSVTKPKTHSMGHRLNGEAVGLDSEEKESDEEMKGDEEDKPKRVTPFQGEGRRLR
jgi:hypothetical protein